MKSEMSINNHYAMNRRASRSWWILLRKYRYIALVAYRRAVTYRGAYLLSLLGNIVRVIAFASLWQAALSVQQGINGFSRQELMTYVFVAFALDGLLSFRTESTIANSVRTGEVTSDLIRPLNHQLLHFSNAVGMALVEGIWLLIITAVLGFAWLDMTPPKDLVSAFAFVLSVLLALIIKFDLAYLTGVAAFWLTDVRGLIVTRATIVGILGGAYFPLEFLPQSIRRLLNLLPFSGTSAIPARIYSGRITGASILSALIQQLFWAIAIWLLSRLIWKKALRRVEINGG
jgi:ABC-2 type transport system permease protein